MVQTKRTAAAFGGGFLFGTIQFLGLLYWIPPVLSHFGGLPPWAGWGLFSLLLAMLGCFPAALCAFVRLCINRRGKNWLLVFIPGWVAFEYLRSYIPFGGFPWLLLGYSQTDFLTLIQAADIAGVYGIGCLIAAVNIALVWIWAHRNRPVAAVVPMAIVLVVFAACLGYGSISLAKWDRATPTHRAALLQGNLSLDDPESDLIWKYRQGYVEMADRLGSEKVDLLVLPESPAPLFYQVDREYRDTLKALAGRYPMGLIFNNIGFRDPGVKQRYCNSAFFLDRSGTEIGRYDKIHLVPFGEYIPLKEIFFFSQSISRDVGDFYPGNTPVTVRLDGHPVNAIICFEAVFPDLSREFILQGSQLIINLTNDGWYGDTSAPYQHLAMARWRAIESRRYLLRAANSGISAIIAPSGRIRTQTGILRRDVAVGGFAFLEGETAYVKRGRDFPILCVIICFLAAFGSLAHRDGAPASGRD